MSPNEIAVLKILEDLGEVGKTVVGRRMGISSDYAGYLCDCLFRGGCLAKVPGGRYKLTLTGAVILRDALYQIHRKLNARITKSRWIRNRMSEKIDGLTNLIEEDLQEKQLRI